MKIVATVAMVVLCVAVLTVTAFAADAPATTSPSEAGQSLGTFLNALYSAALRVVGLAIFVMFLVAGLGKIVPGMAVGNPEAILKDAVIGLVILVSAYVVLNSIHPNLVQLGASLPDIPKVGTGLQNSGPDTRPIENEGPIIDENGEQKRNLGQPCSFSADCVAGGACIGGVCAVAPDGSLGMGDRCVVNRQCKSDLFCAAGAASGVKRCTGTEIIMHGIEFTMAGAPCDMQVRRCQPGYTCSRDATCTLAAQYGMMLGEFCFNNDNCAAGVCVSLGATSGLSECLDYIRYPGSGRP